MYSSYTLAFSHICVYYYKHVYYTYGVQGLKNLMFVQLSKVLFVFEQ